MTEEPSGRRERLTAFLEAAKAKGASDEFLVRLLVERGFPEKKVLDALSGYYESATGIAIPQRGGGTGENARDTFLYLLSFSALGTWSAGVGSLLFTLLDSWLPEPGAHRASIALSYGISGSLASVIVGFPAYLFAMRLILRELGANPEKYESGARKWLTYIALLIASGIVTGDLITFLAFFLRGDLTARFMLKAVTLLVLAGGVFWYYLATMKRALAGQRQDTIFATVATILVLASVTTGFLTLGSPLRQREASWDAKRVSDLRAIAGEVRKQWTRTNQLQEPRLPGNLSALASAAGAQPLSLEDPVSGEPYEYRRRREEPVYELCATFARSSERVSGAGNSTPSFWDHRSGRRCFVLDPARAVPN